MCLLLIVALFTGGMPGSLSADLSLKKAPLHGETQIYLDGKQQDFSYVSFIRHGRTMIPASFLSEVLGAELQWIPEDRLLVLQKDDNLLYLPIDSKTYIKNGEDQETDAPCIIIDSKAYLPIKLISDVFDLDFDLHELEDGAKLLFFYSKDQDTDDKESIRTRILKEHELSKRTYNTQEIYAINLLNLIPNTRGELDVIALHLKDDYELHWNPDDLIDDSVQLLYSLSGKSDEIIDAIIYSKSDSQLKEDVFRSYDNKVSEFLKADKIVFSDREKVLVDRDNLNVFVSALNLSNKRQYLICFRYGPSTLNRNGPVIQSIDVSQQNFDSFDLEAYLKSLGIKSLADEKPVKNRQEASPDRLWRLEGAERVTRTSFYVQKFENGKYQPEIPSSYIVYDRWFEGKSKNDYSKLSGALLDKIIGGLSLEEEEIEELFNDGFRVNMYGEIKVKDPNDQRIKWCRMMENGDKFTPYRYLFMDKRKSDFSELTRKMIGNFPFRNPGAAKSFKVVGKKQAKKLFYFRFLDESTGKEIAPAERLIKYSSEQTFDYDAPDEIDGLYSLVNADERKIALDSKKREEKIEVDYLYRAKKIRPADADFVIEEWRLSKYFPSLARKEQKKKASLRIILPESKEERGLRYGGYISPLNEQKFMVQCGVENDYLKVKQSKETEAHASRQARLISVDCDAPILLSRPTSGAVPAYYEGIHRVRFQISPVEELFYTPLKKEKEWENADKSRDYTKGFGEKLPLQYEHRDAIYNLAVLHLHHESAQKSGIKFSSYEYGDSSSGNFGMNQAASETISVLPKVMMLSDDASGRTDAKFVNGKQMRTVHPISNHRASFHLSNSAEIKSSVSNPQKAASLAKAMSGEKLPVVDKGAKFELTYAAKDLFKLKSYSLEAQGQAYNGEKYHNAYLQSLGMQGNKLNAKLALSFPFSPSSSYSKQVNLIKQGNDRVLRQQIEIRSGKLISVGGVPYVNLSREMKNVLEQMKLTGQASVLSAFARGEGAPVNEQVFSDLSLRYRHLAHPLGSGWYNEDSDALHLVERESVFRLEPTKFTIKAPLNVKGLETPINDRMKYSRGIKADLNIQISLDAKPQFTSTGVLESALIIPNSEQ